MWILILIIVHISFGISLEEAIEIAKESNKELIAQRLAVNSAKQTLKADKNLYLPELFINYRYSYQTETQELNLPMGFGISSSNKDYQSFNLGLRYFLFDGGARSSKVSLSQSNLIIQESLLKEKEQDVVLEVIKAYLSALSAKATVELYEEQERAVRFARDRAQAFYEQGLVAVTDVLQANVRLYEVQRDLEQAKGQYRIALAVLYQLIGKEVEDVRYTQMEPKLEELETYIKTALSKRYILKVYRERVEQAKSLRSLNQSELIPKIFIQGEYVYSDQNPGLRPRGYGVFSAGITLSLQGLSAYYKKLSAIEEEKKAKIELSDTQYKIELSVKKAYEDVLTAKKSLDLSEEGLKFAQKFYELVQEQYTYQIVGMLELLDAQASLTRAKKNREISYYEYLKAYYQLLREGGLLP